jgi:hypothetical protein
VVEYRVKWWIFERGDEPSVSLSTVTVGWWRWTLGRITFLNFVSRLWFLKKRSGNIWGWTKSKHVILPIAVHHRQNPVALNMIFVPWNQLMTVPCFTEWSVIAPREAALGLHGVILSLVPDRKYLLYTVVR